MTEHVENHNNHAEITKLIEENKQLLKENNRLLRKIHRNGVWGFWIRVAWYAVLIGLPFALYFYILEPYFTALGSDYEVFKAGMQEIPGLKSINTVIYSEGQ